MFINKQFSCFSCLSTHRYCVAMSKPKRKRRLVNAFKHLQEEEDSTRGQILAFIHIQEKLWTLWVEICKDEDVKKCIEKREDQGFRMVLKVAVPVVEEKQPFRHSWRNKKAEPAVEKPKRDGVDLLEGQVFQFDLSGDVKLCSESSANTFLGVHYHDRLSENYKRIFVEPGDNPEESYKDISGKLNIYTTVESKEKRECIQSFEVWASAEEVEKYFYVRPPTPEPEPEPEVEPEPVVEETPVTPRIPSSRPPTASFLRLITPMKPPRKGNKRYTLSA